MSTPLAYRLRLRNATNTADVLVATSLRDDDNPFIAEPPTGDGSTLDPVAGKVTVGAYTVLVIDAVGEIPDPTPADPILTDTFESYANTAALDAFWAVGDWGATPSSLPLNTTDALTGSKCAEVTLTGGAAYSGGAGRAHTYTGLTPLAYYNASIDARRLTNLTLGNVNLRVGGFASSILPLDGDPHTITVRGRADASGHLLVQFGYFYSSATIDTPFTTVFDNFALVPVDPAVPFPPLIERIVTASLADSDARQQLLSRVALIEFTEDLGVTWNTMVGAYVNSLRMVDAITYEFTIGESKRIEQAARVFDRISDPAFFPDKIGILDRASCIIGGPIVGDFGPTADRGRPIFKVTNVRTASGNPYVDLQWESGFLYHGSFHEGQPPVDDTNLDFFNGIARDYLDENAAIGVGADSIAPLAAVIVRIYDAGTGAWIADEQATMVQGIGGKGAKLAYRFITSDGSITAIWHSDPPAEGTRYQLAVFPREIGTRNPLHLSGHPIDLYAQLADWKGIPVNQDSVVAAILALGGMVVDLTITAGDTFEPWVTANLFGPFGFTARTNAAGEREVILTRIRPTAVPTTVVTNADLITDQGTPFSVDEASAAIKVTLETKSFRTTDERLDSTPIDSIQATKIVTELLPDDPVTIFGDREIRFTIPGSIRGLVSGTHTYVVSDTDPGDIGGGALWLDTSGGSTIETGAVLKVRNPSNGFWRTWTSTHTDITTTLELSNLLLVLAQAGPLEIWAAQQYGVLFDWQGRGEITYEVSVRRGVVAELVGDEIVLDCAHLPTASVSQFPTSQRGTTPRRCQILRRTEHPEGPTLLLKDRGPAAVDEEAAPSVYQTCPDLDPPTDLAVSMVDTTATLTWVNGDATLEVEVSIRLATDDSPVVIQVLPPGTITFTFALPAESTEYTFAVRHVDAPPLHCTSDYDEVNATTSTFATLSPPIDPAAFSDGAGTFGLEVTATEPAAGVEFWFAAETSAGSGLPGTYAIYATVPSVVGDRTIASTGLAPNNGTQRYLIARHVQSGFLPSAYTDPVSVFPWTLVPPPGPAPGPEPPVKDAVASRNEIAFHTALATGARLHQGVPSAEAELSMCARARRDLTEYARFRILGQVHEAGPAGSVYGIKYAPATLDDPTDECWQWLSGVELTSVLDFDAVNPALVTSQWTDLDLPARQDVHLKVVAKDGDDATPAGLKKLIVEIDGTLLVGNPEQPQPPVSPCDGSDGTDGFEGFVDTADVLATYSDSVEGAGGTITLDPTGGVDGSQALKVTQPGGQTGALTVARRPVTGLTPGEDYTATVDVKLNFVPTVGANAGGLGVTGSGFTLWPDDADGAYQSLSFSWTALSTTHDLAMGYTFGSGFTSGKVAWFDNLTLEGPDGTIPLCGGSVTAGGGEVIEPPPNPAPRPPSGIRRLSLWGMTPSLFATYPEFDGCLFTPSRGSILTDLAAAKAANVQVTLNFVNRAEAKVNGAFSQQAWLNALHARWDGIDISSYIADGTVGSGVVIDEPQLATSGGWGVSIQLEVVENVLAAACAALFPGLQLWVRMRATQMEATGVRFTRCGSWNVYLDGREGTVSQFMAKERAAAIRIGVPWMWAYNYPNGGTNSGTLSLSQITGQGLPLAQDSSSWGVHVWGGIGLSSYASQLAQLRTSSVVAAFTQVRNAMVQP